MKNSLDEIECIPAPVGVKPPYRIVSHPYCVDLIAAYQQIEKIAFDRRDDFLKSIEDNIEAYCRYNDIAFEHHFKNKFALIVPPTANNFQWHLAILLLGYDIHKIHALLGFQEKRYHGETDFATFVEFPVFIILKAWSKFDNSERLERTMQWVNEYRRLNPGDKISQRRIIAPNKEVKAAPSFTLKDYEKDKTYFDNNPRIKKALDDLMGGGFIQKGTDEKKFVAILSGAVIEPENRIDWTGKYTQLQHFVKYLSRHVTDASNIWVIASNCFTKDSFELNRDKVRKAKGKEFKPNKLKEIVDSLSVLAVAKVVS